MRAAVPLRSTRKETMSNDQNNTVSKEEYFAKIEAHLRSIRNMMIFFVVLTVLAITITVCATLAGL
jgi:hypothetical protein